MLNRPQLLLRRDVPLLDSRQAVERERSAHGMLPPHTLMSRAGQAVARLALARYPHARRIALWCGPGNNGGDGLIAAAELQARGCTVRCWLPGPQKPSADDAHWARRHAEAAGVPVAHVADPAAAIDDDCELMIDALFGAGLQRPVPAAWLDAAEALGHRGIPVLAVDMPSGLAGDTGCALGGRAVQADCTLALLSLRPGHFTGDAARHTGDLWFDALQVEDAGASTAQLITRPALGLPPRAATQHKGQSGDVWVIGGAASMAGAPLLAARAALACGAGRVYVHSLASPPLLHDLLQPGLMFRSTLNPAPSACLVFGPGAGDGAEALQALRGALSHAAPLVLDADGLNAVARDGALADALSRRGAATVLTPHPLEAARLLGSSSAEVQRDRLRAARALSQRFRAVTLLKGSGTVLCDIDGRVRINPTGGPRLATAGSGDVLAGVIGALIAQGLAAWDAACTGAYLHGAAADAAAGREVLPASAQADRIAWQLAALRSPTA